MKTVPIPGGTVTVRERGEFTERQRRAVRTAMFAALGDSLGDVDPDSPDIRVKITPQMSTQMFVMRDISIVQSFVSWTLDLPTPTAETVLDLPGDLYDALAEAADGALGGLFTDFSPSPDPASPTSPASASNGLLQAEATPTVTLSTTGGSSSIENSTL